MSLVNLIRNTITVQALNTEIDLIALDNLKYDYIIFGYIDTSNMEKGDVIELSLYLAVDVSNKVKVLSSRYGFSSIERAIYIQPIFVCRDCKARLTLTQRSGSPKSFTYVLVVAPIEQALSEAIRNILFRQVP